MFLQTRHDDPQLVEKVALTWFQVGALREQFGRQDEAVTAYREAATRCEGLAHAHPEQANLWRTAVTANVLMAMLLLNAGRADDARAALDRALALQEERVRAVPSNPDERANLASVHGSFANFYLAQKNGEQAGKWYARAAEV